MSEIKTSSKPFLSIIVPCLDCEKSLGKLFDSLSELKNASFEVIFVDNGSRDGTSTLLEKFSYGAKKKNVRHLYFDKQSGPGAARQHGIEAALGEYIFFVDSDDQIDACGLTTVLAELQQNSKFDDIVFCNASIHDCDGKVSSRDELQYLSGNKIDILKNFLLNRVSPTVMFNLYKRKFLIGRNIQFRSGLHEDVDFSFETLAKMDSWAVRPELIYRKIDRPKSIINSFSRMHLRGYSLAIERIYKQIIAMKLPIHGTQMTDFATQVLGSRISRFMVNQSDYAADQFFADLFAEIMLIDTKIPVKNRLSKCDLGFEKKRWTRLLALFFQKYKTVPSSALVLELKDNLDKYWSCFDINNSVFFAPDEIRTCCKRYHFQGELKGDATLYDHDSLIPEHLNVENIISAKKTLIWAINNGTARQCKGCPHLKLDNWQEPLKEGIKYLSMEYHSLCNMRCNYCSDKYYGGKKPKYNIVETISSCIANQKLLNPDYIVWGGGEPTFEKNFDLLFSMLGSISDTRQRIITNATIFKQEVCDALEQDKAYVVVSIDAGNKKNFENVRGSKRFSCVLKNLKRYALSSPKNVFIKYILQEDNSSSDELREFVDLIQQNSLTSCNFQISCNFKSEMVNSQILSSIVALDSLLRRIGVFFIFWDDLIWQRLPKINELLVEQVKTQLKADNITAQLAKPEDFASGVYLWGTGSQAELLSQKSWVINNSELKGFIDPRPEVWGKKMLGKKIYAPHDIQLTDEKIIIGAVQSAPFIFRQANERQLSHYLVKDKAII